MHVKCHIMYGKWVIVMIILAGFFSVSSLVSAVNQTEEDPIIGSYEYSTGDYVEIYSFLPDFVFEAEGLGKRFNGTWEKISDLQYQATYHDINETNATNMSSDIFLYDPDTDLLWYPAHHRIE